MGPNETQSVLLSPAGEGELGLISDDLQRAEDALALFEEEQGVRPMAGTFICQITWQDRLGAEHARQFQLFKGQPIPIPKAGMSIPQ